MHIEQYDLRFTTGRGELGREAGFSVGHVWESTELEPVVGEDFDEVVVTNQAEVEAAFADRHGHAGFTADELLPLYVDDERRAAKVKCDLDGGGRRPWQACCARR